MKSKLQMNRRRPTYHIVFNKLTYFLSVFAVLTCIIGDIIGLTYGLSAKYWEGSGSRPPIENASVPIQLAQCWFLGLAISNAKI